MLYSMFWHAHCILINEQTHIKVLNVSKITKKLTYYFNKGKTNPYQKTY